jgi:hypothetical protein
MWALWVSRRDRKESWTKRTERLWFVLIGWSGVAVESNIELFYRNVRPTWALSAVVLILLITTFTAIDKSKYTTDKNQL